MGLRQLASAPRKAVGWAYDGIAEFTQLERGLAGLCAFIPLIMIGFNSWKIEGSISAYFSMPTSWAFYVPLTIAAMLFVVNGVVREKHFYNRILGVALFGIILFDHKSWEPLHYLSVIVFFVGNTVVIARAHTRHINIKIGILGVAVLLFLGALAIDGWKIFWLEWASLLVIATHFILDAWPKAGYQAPRSSKEATKQALATSA